MEDIPSKLLNISYIRSDIEFLGIEVNLRKVRWLVICSYNPHKNNISNHLENLSKLLNRNLSQYERFLCIGDFSSEMTEFAMNVYAPLKKKKFRANHASFVAKELRKAIMLRTTL